ncbi:MAG TPA: hypothetical protein VKF16_00315 [Candidatus Dormibacteraeota bacterium]|nr:hypothetical protein [Candidatus Dormibacteraeota bacterium]
MNYSRLGFDIVIVVVIGTVIAVTAVDLFMTFRRKQPVGYYVNEFVIAYPWFGTVLAFIVGALVAHFFLNILDH